MNEQEKYWGCTPVVTAHIEARMKAAREYAKMVSNDDETPAQRADRAITFECGAIWEEGTSKGGWHPASELPPLGKRVIVWYKTADGMYHAIDNLYTSNGWAFYGMNIIAWCYPPEEK